jgi:diguanylate cyclase (GGDEF)-like protein
MTPGRFSHWARFGRWPLSSRIVALSLLLLLLVQSAGFLALRAGIDNNARKRLADELVVGERVWLRLLEQRAAKLGQGAALLAADYGFRSAVSSDDRDTIASALDNQAARIGARVAALLDTRLAVRAQSLGESTAQAAEAHQAAQLLPQLAALAPRLAQQGSAVAVVGGQAYQFVMVPMKAPVLIGWVVMGFELDRSVVDDLHAVAGLHATLVVQAPSAPARLLHSSLPAALQPEAVAAWDGAAPLLQLAGAPHLLRGVPVTDARATTPGAGATPQVLLRLSGSVADAVAPFHALQLTLGALTLIGLVLFGLGSVWTARRVTRPLGALVQASERLGRGDYDTPLGHTGREDEFGDLAKAFEHMRLNIGHNERQIRQLAYWDRLTGLPNREQFRDAVRTATASGGPLAVVMLDLDRFKHVNDVLGYAFGDRLLQSVAQRLQQAVRPGDLVARLGGDEFALLLPQADAALAQAVAVRIASAFEAPLALDDQRVDLSAGLGIACWPAHADDAETLLSRAEVAMYAAKHGKRGAQLYETALDSGSAQTLSLLSELRHAVEHGELRLFMQPKVRVDSGALCGAEALVRWQHPQRGLVPPVQFIPFAEQTGYVRQLTLWVFEEAARQQAALLALGLQRVSINLSTRDLMDVELPDKLEAILLRQQALAEGFCLEITEGAIMDDAQRAKATLERLSQRGYKLSIDDFGTGYSSLAYLQQLPVQELKIDMSFVKGMEKNPGDETIVRSTIELAHNLGLSVVAEGVENAAILQRLAELGCDEAQGYHLSKPVPLAQLQDWAAKRALPVQPLAPEAAPAQAKAQALH